MSPPRTKAPDPLSQTLDKLRRISDEEERTALARQLIANPNSVNRLASILRSGTMGDKAMAVQTLTLLESVARKDARADPTKAEGLLRIAESAKAPLIRALWDRSEPDAQVNEFSKRVTLSPLKTLIVSSLLEMGGPDPMRALTTYFGNPGTHPQFRLYIQQSIEQKLRYLAEMPANIDEAEVAIVRSWGQRVANSAHQPDQESNEAVTHMMGDPILRGVMFPTERHRLKDR